MARQELEEHLRRTYFDSDRNRDLPWVEDLVRPTEPGVPFDLSPPHRKEVDHFIEKARSASAPGPNSVPYRVFKSCPKVTHRLWHLLCTAWNKEIIASSWNKAEGIYLPKEENSIGISAFCPISLLNVDGKIFFGILARRLSKFLIGNGYIDMSIQKAGVPGSPGGIEHTAMIWHTIQIAKRGKKDLLVLWLDLANAYGAIPHAIIKFAMEFFHVPERMQKIILKYYDGFKMRCTMGQFTTSYQALEVGIPMGCTISPILFVMAMKILTKAAQNVCKGVEIASGMELPPLRAFYG